MFYCETCRLQNCWTRGDYGHTSSRGRCEMCHEQTDCYDVPSSRVKETVLERAERKSPPESMIKDMFGPAGPGVPWIPDEELLLCCNVGACDRPRMKNRRLCEHHAFPAERQKSDRRAAIEATKQKKKAESD